MSESVREGAERMRSVGQRLRPIGIGGLAAVVLVVLVLGTASAAPAVAAATSIKDVAPYAGFAFGSFENFAGGCGSTVAVSALPFFNTSSGVGTFAAKATSKNCGSTWSNRSLALTVEYVSPTFTTTTGSHNITADWVLTFVAKLAASGTVVDAPLAVFDIFTVTYLVDQTNDSSFPQVSALVAFNEITSGSYSHTFSKVAAKPSLVAHLKATHTYELELEVYALVGTGVPVGGTSASASISMSGGAQGATLKSVTIK
jgi:hypothetical protein